MKPSLIKVGVALATLMVVYALVTLLSEDPGAAEGRVAVWGDVTHEGAPVEEGTISFAPASGTNGFAAGGGIRAGEYSIVRSDGPTQGTYTVRIMVGSLKRSSPMKMKQSPQSFEIQGVRVDRGGQLDFRLPQD
ncbi:MAG: hypothetical protein AB7U20_01075 [Planctomycetaceae bacterium]